MSMQSETTQCGADIKTLLDAAYKLSKDAWDDVDTLNGLKCVYLHDTDWSIAAQVEGGTIALACIPRRQVLILTTGLYYSEAWAEMLAWVHEQINNELFGFVDLDIVSYSVEMGCNFHGTTIENGKHNTDLPYETIVRGLGIDPMGQQEITMSWFSLVMTDYAS